MSGILHKRNDFLMKCQKRDLAAHFGVGLNVRFWPKAAVENRLIWAT
jgi:hypothetical protein